MRSRKRSSQSKILSQLLFLSIIDDVLHVPLAAGRGKVFNGRCHLSSKTLTTLMTCLLSHHVMGLGQMTSDLWKRARRLGLRINIHQAKVFGLNSCIYLGKDISADIGTDFGIARCINRVKYAFGILSKIWKRKP